MNQRISKRCYHLAGPSAVKAATRDLTRALKSRRFNYVIRADIKGYYASISRKRLLTQLNQHYDDPRLRQYFEQIVNSAIDKNADIFVPTHGIPRRSSLSPFFGALYLSELDAAFENSEGMVYFRYMDDFIILAQSKRQYQRAKKKLFAILKHLELSFSPVKTKMGLLSSFHFLGVHFEMTQIPQSKTQVSTTIYSRSCARALDRVLAMRDDAVHPAIQQRYLIRWATWWSDTIQSMGVMLILLHWVRWTAVRDPAAVWLGRGLLPKRYVAV